MNLNLEINNLVLIHKKNGSINCCSWRIVCCCWEIREKMGNPVHVALFSRPGPSHVLLYKHQCNSLTHYVTHSVTPFLSCLHGAAATTHKIDYVRQVYDILNPERLDITSLVQKFCVIFLDGWILPIGGVSSVEGLLPMRLPRLVSWHFCLKETVYFPGLAKRHKILNQAMVQFKNCLVSRMS